MTAPSGSCHVTVAEPATAESAAALTPSGAGIVGTSGVKLVDASELVPLPQPFVAVTEKVYEVP